MSERKIGEKTKVELQNEDSLFSSFTFLFNDHLESLHMISEAIITGKELDWKNFFPKADVKDKEGGNKPSKETIAAPYLTFLTGQSGLGKTTLLERFAEESKCCSIFLACHEGWAHSLQPLRELIAKLQKDCKRFDHIFNHYSWGLSKISSPEKNSQAQGDSLEEFPDKNTVFVALSSAILDAARHKPLVIIVDDLDMGDSSITDFLAILGRSLRQSHLKAQSEAGALKPGRGLPEMKTTTVPRLFIVASCRAETNSDGPTQEAIKALKSEPFTESIDLPDLTRQQFQRLITQGPWQKLGQKTINGLLDISEKNTLIAKFLIQILSKNSPKLTGSELTNKAEEIKKKGIIRTYLQSLQVPSRRFISLLSLFRRSKILKTLLL